MASDTIRASITIKARAEPCFALQGLCQFDGKETRTRLVVVLGPGTRGRAGLRGAGEAVVQNGATGTFRLDYEP